MHSIGCFHKLGLVLCAIASLTAGWAARPLQAADAGEQQFDKNFGADLRKVQATVSDVRDDLDLVAKLLNAVHGSGATPAFQAALLKHALSLAVQDPAGAASAQAIVEQLVAGGHLSASAGWQAFADAAQPVLQRRKQGTSDPLFEPFLMGLEKQARAAADEGDVLTAEHSLTRLEQAAAANRLKYRAMEAAQLRAQLHYLAPFTAALHELAKIKNGSGDVSATAAAVNSVETITGLTGDFEDVRGVLGGLNDARWNLVLALHPAGAAAGQTPSVAAATAAGRAVQLIDAAEYFNGLAKSNHAPSVQGRAFFLAQAAALWAAAESADATGLSTQQKLDQATRLRTAQDAAQQAAAELAQKLDSLTPAPWIPLQGPALDNDWIRVANTAPWTAMPGNELQVGRSWGSILRHRRSHAADFVLEGELQRCDAQSRPVILLREHNLTGCYCLELGDAQGRLTGVKPDSDEAELALFDARLPVKQWVTFKVVFDGGHMLVWVDGVLKADVKDDGDLTAGGLCIGAALGETRFRNLRIREF